MTLLEALVSQGRGTACLGGAFPPHAGPVRRRSHGTHYTVARERRKRGRRDECGSQDPVWQAF